MKRTIFATLAILLLAGLTGCSESDMTGSNNGDLNVYLTDAPIDLDTVSAVNVEIASMSVIPACDDPDVDCSEMMLDLVPAEEGEPVVVDLLDYRDGAVILIASDSLSEGGYSKIRMEIAAAWLLEDDDLDPETPDVMEDIVVPSSKVDVVVPFTIAAGEETEAVLDFDAALSVQVNETGNSKYILRPVINGSVH